MKNGLSKLQRKEAIEGYLCISPWIIGFLLLTLGPMIYSFYISFCRWDLVNPPKFIGGANYHYAFFTDFRFWQALKVTLLYAGMSLPLGLALSLALAILLNQNVKGMTWFRTLFFIPSILPGVATAMLWRWILNPERGIINVFLGAKIWWVPHFGNHGFEFVKTALMAHPPEWLQSTTWALPSFVLMGLWGVGGGMIIYLAGLQSIPTQLYESAEIDGANSWQRFWKITLPMLSPTIFFNLIMGIIGSLQVFTSSFVVSEGNSAPGGPVYTTLFYLLYLYQQAFQSFQMGYASAMAWVLFVIILICTLIAFKTSSKWVYYESDVKKR